MGFLNRSSYRGELFRESQHTWGSTQSFTQWPPLLADPRSDFFCMTPLKAEVEWANSSGILDVDGNVNAWGLYWRLASGSTIFKVESEYISSYTEHALPFVHYIPIAKVSRHRKLWMVTAIHRKSRAVTNKMGQWLASWPIHFSVLGTTKQSSVF